MEADARLPSCEISGNERLQRAMALLLSLAELWPHLRRLARLSAKDDTRLYRGTLLFGR